MINAILGWLADRPAKLLDGADRALEEVIEKCRNLPGLSALIAWILITAIVVIAGRMTWYDAQVQIAGYRPLFDITFESAFVMMLAVNALQSFGMLAAGTRMGGVLWALSSALNIYVALKWLPVVLPQAGNDPYWGPVIACALAEIPQTVLIVGLRLFFSLMPVAIFGLFGIFGLFKAAPQYARDGLNSAPKSLSDHRKNGGGGIF